MKKEGKSRLVVIFMIQQKLLFFLEILNKFNNSSQQATKGLVKVLDICSIVGRGDGVQKENL